MMGSTGMQFVEYSAAHCHAVRKNRVVDKGMLLQFLEIEREVGIPKRFRGMSVAKACTESGYNPRARGDCYGKNGKCLAVGIIQLHPCYDVKRTDPIASMRFYLEKIKRDASSKKLRRHCPGVKTKADRWQTAWVRVNRGPNIRTAGMLVRKNGKPIRRCSGVPHGLRKLRYWNRSINKKDKK